MKKQLEFRIMSLFFREMAAELLGTSFRGFTEVGYFDFHAFTQTNIQGVVDLKSTHAFVILCILLASPKLRSLATGEGHSHAHMPQLSDTV